MDPRDDHIAAGADIWAGGSIALSDFAALGLGPDAGLACGHASWTPNLTRWRLLVSYPTVTVRSPSMEESP